MQELSGSSDRLTVQIAREPDTLDLPLPRYATAGAAGMDLHAALDAELELFPGARALISTGIRIVLPAGYEGQVRPRSGLAVRHGITVLNAPGTIDADYRGVIKVPLINHGNEPVVLRRGDRIAQLVVASVATVVWDESPDPMPDSPRGDEGFGHTGTRAFQ